MLFERSIDQWRVLPQLSVKECAAVLGVGVDSVRVLLKQSDLEGRHICGKTFVTVPSLRRLMDEEVGAVETIRPQTLTSSERKTVRELREGVGS